MRPFLAEPVRPTRARRADYVFAAWVAASLAFWAAYLVLVPVYLPFPLYAALWLGVGALYLRLAARARAPARSSFSGFMLLSYGAVLVEETIAALANHLAEGFDAGTALVRIGQFWAFNAIAFSGFIFAWYWLLTRVRYSNREALCLAGLFGLYAEHTFALLPRHAIAFIFTVPLIMLSYGLILAPALGAVSERRGRVLSTGLKYLLAIALMLAASIPGSIAIGVVREAKPELFPPAAFIPPPRP